MRNINTDIGTEELAHLEMVGTIVQQLTRNPTEAQIKKGGFTAYFVNHTNGVNLADASGSPFTVAYLQFKGDPITDIHEDLAAEQKARSTYDNILRFADDPDARDPIKFLRQREVAHYQRFGETKRTKGHMPTTRRNTKFSAGRYLHICKRVRHSFPFSEA